MANLEALTQAVNSLSAKVDTVVAELQAARSAANTDQSAVDALTAQVDSDVQKLSV